MKTGQRLIFACALGFIAGLTPLRVQGESLSDSQVAEHLAQGQDADLAILNQSAAEAPFILADQIGKILPGISLNETPDPTPIITAARLARQLEIPLTGLEPQTQAARLNTSRKNAARLIAGQVQRVTDGLTERAAGGEERAIAAWISLLNPETNFFAIKSLGKWLSQPADPETVAKAEPMFRRFFAIETYQYRQALLALTQTSLRGLTFPLPEAAEVRRQPGHAKGLLLLRTMIDSWDETDLTAYLDLISNHASSFRLDLVLAAIDLQRQREATGQAPELSEPLRRMLDTLAERKTEISWLEMVRVALIVGGREAGDFLTAFPEHFPGKPSLVLNLTSYIIESSLRGQRWGLLIPTERLRQKLEGLLSDTASDIVIQREYLRLLLAAFPGDDPALTPSSLELALWTDTLNLNLQRLLARLAAEIAQPEAVPNLAQHTLAAPDRSMELLTFARGLTRLPDSALHAPEVQLMIATIVSRVMRKGNEARGIPTPNNLAVRLMPNVVPWLKVLRQTEDGKPPAAETVAESLIRPGSGRVRLAR